MESRVYRYKRKRGLAAWRPRQKSVILLEQVRGILDEYRDHLPLTGRQVFYRLVGAHGYDKTEQAYERLLNILNRARRNGDIPFDAIRDDGVTASVPSGFDDQADFWSTIRSAAGRYRRDRQAGQRHFVEVWVEAAGMVPQASRVAHRFGIPVYSSGGFDSTTAKHDAAQRIIDRSRKTVVLHVGDYDPSGLSIFDAVAEDVGALVGDLAGADDLGDSYSWKADFRRVIVTPDQIKRYQLPTAPPKKTDRRGDWHDQTVQAESLSPDDLANELTSVIEGFIDADVFRSVMEAEQEDRRALIARLDDILSD